MLHPWREESRSSESPKRKEETIVSHCKKMQQFAYPWWEKGTVMSPLVGKGNFYESSGGKRELL